MSDANSTAAPVIGQERTDEVDPAIRRLFADLNEAGFRTTSSCQGKRSQEDFDTGQHCDHAFFTFMEDIPAAIRRRAPSVGLVVWNGNISIAPDYENEKRETYIRHNLDYERRMRELFGLTHCVWPPPQPHRKADPRMEDLAGRRFGRLLVAFFAGRAGSDRRSMWTCYCNCGKTTTVIGKNMQRRITRSCRCLSIQLSKNRHHKRIHGGSETNEYRAWSNMKSRCLRKSCRAYPDYGGRGITVCQSLRDSFQHFMNVIGPRPTSKHTLGRIDNDGNYECGHERCDDCVFRGATCNIRWETRREQYNNRRATIFVVHNGERMPLVEACRLAGVPAAIARVRLKQGWPEAAAVSLPRGSHYFKKGESPLARG